MESIRTTFVPETDGFQFINRFELSDFFKIDLPVDLSFLRHDGNMSQILYGLCGGMSFGALDYRCANRSVPQDTDPEEIPYRLFRFLLSRQMDSLKPPVLGNVIKWMVLDNRYALQQTGKWEIPNLLKELRAMNPTTLVLIRSALPASPAQNHQVLATGFDYEESSGDLTIYLYDPNHPHTTSSLQVRMPAPGRRLDISQPGDVTPRGFFTSAYSAVLPA